MLTIQGFTDNRIPDIFILGDPLTELIKVKVAARITVIYSTDSHTTYSNSLNNPRWQNFTE